MKKNTDEPSQETELQCLLLLFILAPRSSQWFLLKFKDFFLSAVCRVRKFALVRTRVEKLTLSRLVRFRCTPPNYEPTRPCKQKSHGLSSSSVIGQSFGNLSPGQRRFNSRSVNLSIYHSNLSPLEF